MDRHQDFLKLFMAHQQQLKAFVASVLRDWHRSEDLIQELAVVLWRRFDDYDPARPFGAWARGVAHNLILKEYEKRQRDMPLLSPEAIAAVDRGFEQLPESFVAEQTEALRSCLGKLKDRAQRMIELRYLEGMKVADVADQMNRSVDAVKKGLSRIRTVLHDCIRVRLAGARDE